MIVIFFYALPQMFKFCGNQMIKLWVVVALLLSTLFIPTCGVNQLHVG